MNVPAAGKVRFDEDLIRRYDGRGPRYTSYPTALQFDKDLGADHYRANAEQSNASGLPLSLYVHIPFCHSLCYYCGCNKVVTRNQPRVERYLDNLRTEIQLQGELFDRERKVEQLHFGGGTPTYLNESQLDELLARLRRHFSFDESDGHEFSIEVDPRTVTARSIAQLRTLGFNRLSLGIQDFDPAVQQAINRVQNIESVVDLLESARSAQFRSVSFDLIYGLPKQTATTFDQTIDAVVGMRPDRLAVYNYAHLPDRFRGQRMINSDDLPSPEMKLDILRRTIERLDEAGYVYIGMDHFALPGDELVTARSEATLQRNFQGYSTHRQCDLVALGVSSISNIGPVFAQNAATTMEYEALLGDGRLPVTRGVRVDADDLLRAAVIQSLMCYDSVDFAAFEREYAIDFDSYFASELARLEPLAADGLITVDADGVNVTTRGRLLLRNVAMVFDRYLNTDYTEIRYSKAI